VHVECANEVVSKTRRDLDLDDRTPGKDYALEHTLAGVDAKEK